ncbi:DUF159-domain-containing protein [Cubamyces sp. BRFM 1775]|nr:DUF159-domain-containing protein [Cubamyces sp. BRFM 1775]
MCGRFSLGIPHDEIQQLHGYNVRIGEWVGRDNFVPRHNIAPRSQAPVIRRRDGNDQHAAGSSGSRTQPDATSTAESTAATQSSPPTDDPEDPAAIPNAQSTDRGAPTSTLSESMSTADAQPLMLHTMEWGLVPHFSKHEDPTLKTINARCEALIEGQAGIWASIKGRKRCAVVCEGYYEWLKKGKERLPHFTRHKDGRLMLLAGLWDCTVLSGSTEPLWTFTIVTTDASKEFSWLHDRQPVILSDEAALETWLDTSSGKWTPELSKLCAPYHAADHPLVCYQVPKEAGKIGTESPTFIQPIQERKDGIQALFARQQQGITSSPSKSTTTLTPTTPSKHVPKRNASEIDDGGGADGLADKKAKVEKVNAWEDDSDIEYIDDPGPQRHKTDTSTNHKVLASCLQLIALRTSSVDGMRVRYLRHRGIGLLAFNEGPKPSTSCKRSITIVAQGIQIL